VDIEWKWPDKKTDDWENSDASDDSIGDSGLAKLMLHLWTRECGTGTQVAPTPEQQKEGWLTQLILKYKDASHTLPLNTSNVSPPFNMPHWPKSFTLFLYDLRAPKSGTYF